MYKSWLWLKRFLLWISGAEAIADERPPAAVVAPEADQQGVKAKAVAGGPAQPPPGEAASAPRSEPAPVAPAPQERTTVLDDVINDATAYGVEIEPAAVPPGTTYWRVIRVHHLTPEENHGNHHLYLDVLDEDGQRMFGAQVLISWEGGQQVVTIDKPQGEPGANFPMWKWQICAAEALGLPSDRVTNLHTAHPDEPPGNTLFHHSFRIDFQRAVKEGPPEQSTISGAVSNAEGLSLLLTRADEAESGQGELVASVILDATGAFSFTHLGPGIYVLIVEGTGVRSDPISLDGTNSVTINLAVPESPPASDKPLPYYVLFGPPESPRTAIYLALARQYLADVRPAFGFSPAEAALAQKVILLGGPDDIPPSTEVALIEAGCQVHRIRGTVEQIRAALEGRESEGHQFFLPLTPT